MPLISDDWSIPRYRDVRGNQSFKWALFGPTLYSCRCS